MKTTSSREEKAVCSKDGFDVSQIRAATWMVIVLALFAIGCANVQPWERGTLADPVMRPDRNALGLQLADHMWFSREAALGGRGVGGGGCGCN